MTPSLKPARLFLLGLAASCLASAAWAQSADRLAEADANGDGQIEWQEVLDLRLSAFERLDQNGDGFADSEDVPRFGPARARMTAALANLADADTNGDRRISKTEMLEAPAPVFTSADTDEDGVLSAEELAAHRDSVQAD